MVQKKNSDPSEGNLKSVIKESMKWMIPCILLFFFCIWFFGYRQNEPYKFEVGNRVCVGGFAVGIIAERRVYNHLNYYTVLSLEGKHLSLDGFDEKLLKLTTSNKCENNF